MKGGREERKSEDDGNEPKDGTKEPDWNVWKK